MNVSTKTLVGPALLWCVAAVSTVARADVITDWNATTQAVLVAKGHQGPPGYAFVHVPMYDAVNAIDGGYTVFAVRPTSDARGASKEAAAATAAYRVLLGAYPDQTGVLDPAYAASLAAIPDGPAKTKGIAIGTEVAAGWLALRAGDGREAVVPYVFQPAAPGVYQRTPPAFPNALAPWLAVMRPFAITSPSQFRVSGPPDLTSDLYAQDVAFTQATDSQPASAGGTGREESSQLFTSGPGPCSGARRILAHPV